MGFNIFLIFLGMALVTYIPRLLPMALFTRLEVPDPVIRWLNYVPVAILSALLAPGVLMDKSNLFISHTNPFLLASVPTFLVAYKTKSMMITILVGLILVIGIRNLIFIF